MGDVEGAASWVCSRHQGITCAPSRSSTCKESLAPSLPGGGAAYSNFPTAFAELLLSAQLWVRSGQVGTSILASDPMLTAPLSCQACGCLFPAGQTPWNLILPRVLQPHTRKLLPMSCLFICLFNKYLSTGCARNYRLPGDEAVEHQIQSVCSWRAQSSRWSSCHWFFFFF